MLKKSNLLKFSNNIKPLNYIDLEVKYLIFFKNLKQDIYTQDCFIHDYFNKKLSP